MLEALRRMTSPVTDCCARTKETLNKDLRGWVICMCVLVITVVRSGITYSFGIFVVRLEALYHRPLAEQNWIGTLSFCISLSCAPLSVLVIRMTGYNGYRITGIFGTLILFVSCLASSFVSSLEWMFLTHSLLYGVGSSLIYMASSLVIGEYFDKDHPRHVLATSILLIGYPIGSLVFNPINAWLVNCYGWRVAFRVTSGLVLVSGLICCVSFKSKSEFSMQRLGENGQEDEPPKKRKCCGLQDVVARPEIILWLLGNMLSYLGFFMPFVNLAFYMEIKGIPTDKSAWALTLLSLAECITYIIASLLGDMLKGKLIWMNVIASFALSIVCYIWPSVDINYNLILMISLIMGGFLGMTIVYNYAASGEVTQLEIDVAWSCTNLWSGFGILLGPFFSGAIYDVRHSYDDVFYVIGGLYTLDAILFAAIPILQKFRTPRNKLDYNEIQGVIDYKATYVKKTISNQNLVDNDELTSPE